MTLSSPCRSSQLVKVPLIAALLVAVPGTAAFAWQAGKQPKKQPVRKDDGRDAAEVARLRKRVDELTRELEKARRLEGELREARATERRLREAGEALQRRLADVQADNKRGEALLRKLDAERVELRRALDAATRDRLAALDQLARTQALLRKLEADSRKDQGGTADEATAAVAAAEHFRQTLLKSLEATDPAVRRWGAEALGDLGGEARFALPALDRVKDDKDPTVAAAVNAAVVKIRAAINKQPAKKR